MRLLGICPRITKQDQQLIATTALRIRILLLGLFYRRVEVNTDRRCILIRGRYLWLIRTAREIEFDQIVAVTYGYEDWAMDFSYGHDSFDWFTVGLRLTDDSELMLFNFVGDGSFSNNGPYPDWMYWDDYAFDTSGSQEKESRIFVDLLSKMIDRKVIPPRC